MPDPPNVLLVLQVDPVEEDAFVGFSLVVNVVLFNATSGLEEKKVCLLFVLL